MMAQNCELEVPARKVTPLRVGIGEGVPLPVSLPQQVTVPSSRSAHMEVNLAASWTTLVNPDTTRGTSEVAVLAPWPSWCWVLAPQQRTVPSVSAAQAKA